MTKSHKYEILFQPTIAGGTIVLLCDSFGHADKAASLIAMSYTGDVMIRDRRSGKCVSMRTYQNT